MTTGIDIYEEARPWGNFRQFTKNCSSTVKILTINQGETLSRQSHEHRSEFWRILSGRGTVEIDVKKSDATPGEEYSVPQGSNHRLACARDSSQPMQVLEISFGNFEEDDIIRSEDKYGRT